MEYTVQEVVVGKRHEGSILANECRQAERQLKMRPACILYDSLPQNLANSPTGTNLQTEVSALREVSDRSLNAHVR